MAAFQVFLYGRFWVFTEASEASRLHMMPVVNVNWSCGRNGALQRAGNPKRLNSFDSG